MSGTTDILIVGGGLAGLSLADQLHRTGRDFQLVEARDRLGGRILTEHCGAGYFDMGPAWFWPGQPRIAALIERFRLKHFEQHHTGILSYEDEQGHVQRGKGFASMQGSYRLEGGLQSLIDALAKGLPQNHIHLDSVLHRIEQTADGIAGFLSDECTTKARHVVLTTPPRVAAELITFHPALPVATTDIMHNIPTWMAGQAKAIATYDRPFWRDQGLSGDATSRIGPLVEIHDASPETGGPFALFGFIGVPPKGRLDQALLKQHTLAQLGRVFGPAASEPKTFYIRDWATEPYTATPRDHAPLYAHPQYGLPAALDGIWDGKIMFGGTEVARQFGGYLEGALEGAEMVFSKLAPAVSA
ncbi:MAG: NAD(P)/FAD-dependent oxidoreductase [Sulfitobacter sp.]